jgi:hypothetical protein
MKTNVLKSLRGQGKQKMMINKAISRFISNTQKIVQKVKPEAKILIRKKRLPKRPKNHLSSSKLTTGKVQSSRLIQIPDFHGK